MKGAKELGTEVEPLESVNPTSLDRAKRLQYWHLDREMGVEYPTGIPSLGDMLIRSGIHFDSRDELRASESLRRFGYRILVANDPISPGKFIKLDANSGEQTLFLKFIEESIFGGPGVLFLGDMNSKESLVQENWVHKILVDEYRGRLEILLSRTPVSLSAKADVEYTHRVRCERKYSLTVFGDE